MCLCGDGRVTCFARGRHADKMWCHACQSVHVLLLSTPVFAGCRGRGDVMWCRTAQQHNQADVLYDIAWRGRQ